jgi:hypothetical protein
MTLLRLMSTSPFRLSILEDRALKPAVANFKEAPHVFPNLGTVDPARETAGEDVWLNDHLFPLVAMLPGQQRVWPKASRSFKRRHLGIPASSIFDPAVSGANKALVTGSSIR